MGSPKVEDFWGVLGASSKKPWGYNEANLVQSIKKASEHSNLGFDALKDIAKSRYFQGFLLKGTKMTNGRKPVRGKQKSDHRMGDRIFVVHKSMYHYSVVIML